MAVMSNQALLSEIAAYEGSDNCDPFKKVIQKKTGVVIAIGWYQDRFDFDSDYSPYDCDDWEYTDDYNNKPLFVSNNSSRLTARDYEDDTGFVDDGPWGQWDSSYKNRDDVFYP